MTVYAIYHRHFCLKKIPYDTEQDAIDCIRYGEEEGNLIGVGIYNDETNTAKLATHSIIIDDESLKSEIRKAIGNEQIVFDGEFSSFYE